MHSNNKKENHYYLRRNRESSANENRPNKKMRDWRISLIKPKLKRNVLMGQNPNIQRSENRRKIPVINLSDDDSDDFVSCEHTSTPKESSLTIKKEAFTPECHASLQKKFTSVPKDRTLSPTSESSAPTSNSETLIKRNVSVVTRSASGSKKNHKSTLKRRLSAPKIKTSTPSTSTSGYSSAPKRLKRSASPLKKDNIKKKTSNTTIPKKSVKMVTRSSSGQKFRLRNTFKSQSLEKGKTNTSIKAKKKKKILKVINELPDDIEINSFPIQNQKLQGNESNIIARKTDSRLQKNKSIDLIEIPDNSNSSSSESLDSSKNDSKVIEKQTVADNSASRQNESDKNAINTSDVTNSSPSSQNLKPQTNNGEVVDNQLTNITDVSVNQNPADESSSSDSENECDNSNSHQTSTQNVNDLSAGLKLAIKVANSSKITSKPERVENKTNITPKLNIISGTDSGIEPDDVWESDNGKNDLEKPQEPRLNHNIEPCEVRLVNCENNFERSQEPHNTEPVKVRKSNNCTNNSKKLRKSRMNYDMPDLDSSLPLTDILSENDSDEFSHYDSTIGRSIINAKWPLNTTEQNSFQEYKIEVEVKDNALEVNHVKVCRESEIKTIVTYPIDSDLQSIVDKLRKKPKKKPNRFRPVYFDYHERRHQNGKLKSKLTIRCNKPKIKKEVNNNEDVIPNTNAGVMPLPVLDLTELDNLLKQGEIDQGLSDSHFACQNIPKFIKQPNSNQTGMKDKINFYYSQDEKRCVKCEIEIKPDVKSLNFVWNDDQTLTVHTNQNQPKNQNSSNVIMGNRNEHAEPMPSTSNPHQAEDIDLPLKLQQLVNDFYGPDENRRAVANSVVDFVKQYY